MLGAFPPAPRHHWGLPRTCPACPSLLLGCRLNAGGPGPAARELLVHCHPPTLTCCWLHAGGFPPSPKASLGPALTLQVLLNAGRGLPIYSWWLGPFSLRPAGSLDPATPLPAHVCAAETSPPCLLPHMQGLCHPGSLSPRASPPWWCGVNRRRRVGVGGGAAGASPPNPPPDGHAAGCWALSPASTAACAR